MSLKLYVFEEIFDIMIFKNWFLKEEKGFVKYSYLIASTTTVLNWSDISDKNVEICFINRSTPASLPVYKIQCDNNNNRRAKCLTLRRVVIANVAIDRLESVINVSRSTLQAVTAAGYWIATYKGKGKNF